MTDLKKLVEGFLEDAATHGSGAFAERASFLALKAAVRPDKPVGPPPEPAQADGKNFFDPKDAKNPVAAHLENLAGRVLRRLR